MGGRTFSFCAVLVFEWDGSVWIVYFLIVYLKFYCNLI